MEEKKVVVDTSALFVSVSRLRSLVDSGAQLSVPDLVLFEFVKSVRKEGSIARGNGNTRRVELMSALEERLPHFLTGLEAEVWGSDFDMTDLAQFYRLLQGGHEPGDAMIWIKMRKAGLDTIATADASDWRALGADVISLA